MQKRIKKIFKKSLSAFTLAEMIVVVTILAILGTISFLSFQNYAKESRDTVRLSDLVVVEKSLELYQLKNGGYPVGDNAVSVTYSGGLLWHQGYIDASLRRKIGNLSNIPIDPLLNVEYSYSVFNKLNKYQIGLIFEGKQGYSNVTKKTYALSNKNIKAYISGNYNLLDVRADNSGNCLTVALPSIIINDLPAGNALINGGDYHFVYDKSVNLPDNYESNMTMTNTGFTFQMSEIYNKCSVDSLSDLNTYIINLSSAYQQFSGVAGYEEVVNNARTISFIKKAVVYLRSNGTTIEDDTISMLDSAFIDTFSGNDNDILVDDHTSDTLTNWSLVSPSTNSGAYIIFGNSLKKATNSTDAIKANLLKAKTGADTTATLKVLDFNGGNIIVYGRYQDQDNYYFVTLNSSGYSLGKKVGGVTTNLSVINTAISNNSNIQFVLSGFNVKLIIDGNELENIVDTDITSAGIDVLELSNSGTIVDDYTLYFQ